MVSGAAPYSPDLISRALWVAHFRFGICGLKGVKGLGFRVQGLEIMLAPTHYRS